MGFHGVWALEVSNIDHNMENIKKNIIVLKTIIEILVL